MRAGYEHDPEKWPPVFGKDHAPPIDRPGRNRGIGPRIRDCREGPQSLPPATACLHLNDETSTGIAHGTTAAIRGTALRARDYSTGPQPHPCALGRSQG